MCYPQRLRTQLLHERCYMTLLHEWTTLIRFSSVLRADNSEKCCASHTSLGVSWLFVWSVILYILGQMISSNVGLPLPRAAAVCSRISQHIQAAMSLPLAWKAQIYCGCTNWLYGICAALRELVFTELPFTIVQVCQIFAEIFDWWRES